MSTTADLQRLPVRADHQAQLPAAPVDLEPRDKYPMKVQPSGPVANELREFLNTGNRAILDRLVKNQGIDFDRPLVIDVMDLSTSIGRGIIPDAIVKNQRLQKNFLQDLASSGKGADLWQFGLTNDLQILQPQRESPVDFTSVKTFNRSELRERSSGGLLGPGSRLSDALYLTAELALAYRRTGFEKAIGVAMITDGWNRNASVEGSNAPALADRDPSKEHGNWIKTSENYAYHSIAAARMNGVTFRVLGFVEPHGVVKFDAFRRGVGLLLGEASHTVCKPEDPHAAEASVDETYRQHTQFYDDVTRRH